MTRICAVCSAVIPETARADKRACSRSCRNKAATARRQRLVELARAFEV